MQVVAGGISSQSRLEWAAPLDASSARAAVVVGSTVRFRVYPADRYGNVLSVGGEVISRNPWSGVSYVRRIRWADAFDSD